MMNEYSTIKNHGDNAFFAMKDVQSFDIDYAYTNDERTALDGFEVNISLSTGSMTIFSKKGLLVSSLLKAFNTTLSTAEQTDYLNDL